MARKRKKKGELSAEDVLNVAPAAETAAPAPRATPARSTAARGGAATAAVEYEKPHLNVYTIMLLISFVALVLGSVLLYLELQPYGNFLEWWQTTGV